MSATWDEAGPADAAQVGSDMSQTGANITQGTMCVHDGDLYWAWSEDTDIAPYVAKWNGSDWDLIADSSVFGGVVLDGGPRNVQVRLATDGVNLYFAFEREFSLFIANCHASSPTAPDASELISPYIAECWQFDGASWTLLGSVGSLKVVNDGTAEWASTTLELSAGPHEPGAAYIAFFEEGFEGNSETNRWFSRHLRVAGFGTSTLGEVDFDGLLFQMDRPVDILSRCIAPVGAGAYGFSMRLVGTGDQLALYSQAYDYDVLTQPYWTKIDVWTTSGMTEVDLATDFSSADVPATVVGYGPPVIVSENDVAGDRWVAVRPISTFGSQFRIVRETTATAPATFAATFGLADHSADLLQDNYQKLVGETGNLWAIPTGGSGAVELLTDRCGSVYWANENSAQFSAGIVYSFTTPAIFDDAIWLSGGPGHGNVRAFSLPICRACGMCGSGFRAWQRF